MPKVKVVNNPEHDSTLPKVKLKLGNETYYLCYTFAALTLAETKLNNEGISCNILKALDLSELDARNLSALLYAGLLTHKPDITIEKVLSLITFKNMQEIPPRILEAYAASLADPSDEDVNGKADPTQPK